MLERAGASGSVAVAELVNGHWQRVPGTAARVEIASFSTKTFAFLEGAQEALNTGLTVLETVQSIRAVFDPSLTKGTEAELRQRIEAGSDATKAFYGVGESASVSQTEMCAQLKTSLAERQSKLRLSFPGDYGGPITYAQLGLFLFKADTPEAGGYFWNLTQASHAAIEKQVLASGARLKPADFLNAAIDANGGNVPLGVLAAHNYLKEKAYAGRALGEGAVGGVDKDVANAVAKLEPWRSGSSMNPAGEYDKMGPLYHIFAAMTAGVWGPRGLGQTAVTGEALLRSFGVGADTPDIEKGMADQCGAETASWILTNLKAGELCAEGAINLPNLTGVTFELNRFSLCFPPEGGTARGKIELTFSSKDEDCSGRFVDAIDLQGTLAAGKLSGTAVGSTEITLSGVCKSERLVFDKPSYPVNAPWDGAFDGSNVKLTVRVDPEDPDDNLILEGKAR